LLPTFLRKGYERFYQQVFNLAAGNLRRGVDAYPAVSSLPAVPHPQSPQGPLAQALTSVLREAYPRAREAMADKPTTGKDFHIARYLNAAGVQLDGAFLSGADLKDAWLRESTFRGATLRGTILEGAILEGSDCSGTILTEATSREANLKK
jgi:Pentapeptide repeats (8 copies)